MSLVRVRVRVRVRLRVRVPQQGEPVVHHTVRGTYGTPEAGTRTAYVPYWAPRGKLPCASVTYSTQEAGTRSPCVQYEGPGAYA